jgi:hypothetical protein
MRVGAFLALLLVPGFALACSGESDSSGGGPSGTCDSLCQTLLAENCPAETEADCLSTCEQNTRPWFDTCPAQAGQYLGCVQTRVQFSCDTDGTAVAEPDAINTACRTEVVAIAGCTACLPDTDDDACESCRKANCCNEWRALVGHPSSLDFVDCYQACPPDAQGCIIDCLDRFPGYRSAAEQVASCEGARCSDC